MNPTEFRDLAGTVIVVTGAGSGIGHATAHQLLAAGANVVAGEFRPARLEQLLDAFPGQVAAVAADVSDPRAAEELIAAGHDRWGKVDSVIANAGVGFYGGILETTTEQIRLMTQTNYLGTVWLARAAVAHFRERTGGGDIVILGSVAGLGVGGGKEAAYAATKAAQIQFGTSLQREVRSEGIRVTVIAPAAVNTGFAAATGRFGDTPPEEGPFINPSQIASAVITTLRQPRGIRTALWELWSLAEPYGES